MAETPGRASDQKRAAWVALRTLRLRPKVVDHRENGDPIFEIRSVRLILRDNADHFNRLAECSKCGREVPGASVLSPADLSRPSQKVVCKDCVWKATGGSRWRAPVRRDEPTAPPLEVPEGVTETLVGPTADEVAADGRLSVVESELGVLLARLDDLAETQQAEARQRREVDEVLQSRLRAALVKGLDDVRARVEASVTVDRSLVVAFEDRLRQDLAGAAELIEGQRSEVATLASALAEARDEIRRIGDANGELAVAHSDVDRRLAEVTTWISSQPTEALGEALRREIAEVEARLARPRRAGSPRPPEASTGLGAEEVLEAVADAEARLARAAEGQREELRAVLTEHLTDAFRAELAEAEARLARAAEVQRTELHATLAEALSQARDEAAAVEQRLLESSTALTRLVETQGDELGTGLTDYVAREMATVAGAVSELREGREQMQTTLDDLLQRAARAEAGLHDLVASTDAGDGRLQALEQNTRKSLDRLTGLIATERRMRARTQVVANRSARERPAAASTGAGTGSLLDDLDRQLQQAEQRLWRTVSSSDQQ